MGKIKFFWQVTLLLNSWYVPSVQELENTNSTKQGVVGVYTFLEKPDFPKSTGFY